MAYNHDTVTAATVLDQIKTRLTGGGWTAHDASYGVYKTTTDDGKVIYLQLTEAAGEYIQLQAWHSWDAGTHVGTTGSGTTYGRVYYASSPVGGAITVELYTSVTTNRIWMVIDCPTGALRGWGYFGGLDTATADADAVVLGTNYADNRKLAIWHTSLSASAAWNYTYSGVVMPFVCGDGGGQDSNTVSDQPQYNPQVWDASKYHMWRVPCCDNSASTWCTGANAVIRGLLDGVRFVSRQGVTNFDTLTELTTAFLVVFPIAKSAANCFFGATPLFALALAEL